jgi:hypothetical protein
MVTIVPDYGQCALGEMDEIRVTVVWLRTARILRKVGVGVAFGGIDFSVNRDRKGATPYFQVQFTLFIPEKLWPKSYTKLRAALNRSGRIYRPIRAKFFDGDNAGLAYALKYEFEKRDGFQQSEGARRDKHSRKDTRNRPLGGPNWAKVMVLLDRIDLEKRVVLIGVKRIRKNGEVIMQRIE